MTELATTLETEALAKVTRGGERKYARPLLDIVSVRVGEKPQRVGMKVLWDTGEFEDVIFENTTVYSQSREN